PMFTGTRIWKTNTTRWNFASSIGFPLADTNVDANIVFGPHAGERKDHLFTQYDMLFVPVVASYHISKLEHVAFSMTVWAPTGDYQASGRLANNGMNCWTFVPTFAYTRIWPTRGMSFDVNYGVGFYTENPDTNYKSGALSNLDLLFMKNFKGGFGIGPVF